jgi:hypothetical protein
MPPNGFMPIWGGGQPQPIINYSEEEQISQKAMTIQTDMLKLFPIIGQCDWEDCGKLKSIKLPTLSKEMKNILNEPTSIRATQLVNLF